MRIWQAHIALAQMMGDPIIVSGSPVTVIPDGVRYSRQLRDLYLYRAMLSIMDSIVQPALQVADVEASSQLQRYMPNYVVEDIIPFASWSLNDELLLSRRPVTVHSVWFERTQIAFARQPANRFHAIQSTNPYHDISHDAMYSILPAQVAGGTEAYGKGRLKIRVPAFVNTTDDIHVLYVPTPLDPSTQTANSILDFEPLMYDKIITTANTFAKADAQETQAQ